jgi:hypothetical protein
LTNFHISVVLFLVIVEQVMRGIFHGVITRKEWDNKDRGLETTARKQKRSSTEGDNNETGIASRKTTDKERETIPGRVKAKDEQ